jgi:hypothetical protein
MGRSPIQEALLTRINGFVVSELNFITEQVRGLNSWNEEQHLAGKVKLSLCLTKYVL